MKDNMKSTHPTPARSYDKGMGEAVANRTVNRKISVAKPREVRINIPRMDDISLSEEVKLYCKSNNLVIDGYHVDKGNDKEVRITLNVTHDIVVEEWADVAKRVATGNGSLDPRGSHRPFEIDNMEHHLRQAAILMSGRHLQHGDANQSTRNMEVFTNCSTAAASFLSFYLLLNGSGVGRCYDDDMMVIDWNNMPTVACVIDYSHKDVVSGEITAAPLRDAQHFYRYANIHHFVVPDSREGWAKAIEKLEYMSFDGSFKDDVLLIDFNDVRPRGSPIGGMQDRPASGPGPMMSAITKVARIKDAGMEPWLATMYMDHYFAECVLVGGARRAARMATKTWTDPTIFGFIQAKRGGFLWTSNNSVTVDTEFWTAVNTVDTQISNYNTDPLILVAHKRITRREHHAWKVFNALCEAAYHDQTGEPGIITVDKLTWLDEGTEVLMDGDYAESDKFKLEPETLKLTAHLAKAWKAKPYKVITNPCGEIVLSSLGGYCVLGSVVPYHASNNKSHAEWDADATDAFKVATRALIRTNLMNSMYNKEVKRTNRIGVALVGIHEYAWARYGLGWKELVNEAVSIDFWAQLSTFKRAVQAEAIRYAAIVGSSIPHTDTTMVPAGTISKLFGLTEGAHLPSMREFMRWVQFANGDPLIQQYKDKGYPVRELQVYKGMTIVGFPTQPLICTLGMGDSLVTAAEATPEEQYRFLQLLEKYWITGVSEDGVTPLRESGNQVSYTLKYDPKVVSYDQFRQTTLDGQATIRCCSVMPQADTGASAYEYLPEQPVTKAEYDAIAAAIQSEGILEDVGQEHVECAGGACPISFGKNVAA